MFHRLLFIGGRRAGKTKSASIAAAEEASIPGTIGWCCAPTIPKLHRYVIPAMQQIIPAQWVRNYDKENQDLWLKNGSLIHFQTLESPDQGRGQGLDWLWIDEVTELTKTHWEVIRPSLTEKRGVALFTSSPRSYDWVYSEFFQRAQEGVPGYWAARCKTSDSPVIDPEELAEARATMTDAMFRQEYEADFVIFTGAVYGGLVEPQILRSDDAVRQILPEWPNIDSWRQILVGVDTGADHPFGGVKIVATEKGLVVVGEYLERNKTFLQHANALKRLANSATAKYAINKNERQPSFELAQHGVYCQKAENEVVAGTERVKSWLVSRQLWFVESHAPKTIQQLKSYRWAEPKSKDGQLRERERVFKLEDELPDCLRYACMVYPILPSGPPEELPKQRDISMLPEDMQHTIMRLRLGKAHFRGEPAEKDEQQGVVSGLGEFY